jgi:hypothetical protein
MMFLKPDGKIDLEHREYFLRGAPNRSVVIAAAAIELFVLCQIDQPETAFAQNLFDAIAADVGGQLAGRSGSVQINDPWRAGLRSSRFGKLRLVHRRRLAVISTSRGR